MPANDRFLSRLYRNASAALRRGGLLPSASRSRNAGSAKGSGPGNRLSGPISASAPATSLIVPAARERLMLPEIAHLTVAQLEHILRSGLQGESPAAEHALYRLMIRSWPRLMKNINEVRNAVLGLDWSVMLPDDGDPTHSDILRRVAGGMRPAPANLALGWRATLSALLDAWFMGVAAVELEWEWSPGRPGVPAAWLPVRSYRVGAEHLAWGAGDGRLVLIPDPARSLDRREFDDFPDKFLVAVADHVGGHPSGGALLRPLAWWWLAGHFSAEWLLNFAQIFGIPIRWATYDPNSPGAKEALVEMMESMGSAAWGAGPSGTTVEILDAAKGGSDSPQVEMLSRAETNCDLLILGQTLTSDVGDSGSRALGEVHSAVRADVIDAAAEWLTEILAQQLAPAVLGRNLASPPPTDLCPWWEPDKKERRDQKTLAEVLEILGRAGVRIPRAWAHEALDIPEPEEGEEVIAPPAPAGPPPISGPASAVPPPTPGPTPAETTPPTLSDPASIRRLMARLPLDAREYLLARLGDPDA